MSWRERISSRKRFEDYRKRRREDPTGRDADQHEREKDRNRDRTPHQHRSLGRLYRELALLRRLLRLSQAARAERRELHSGRPAAERREVARA